MRLQMGDKVRWDHKGRFGYDFITRIAIGEPAAECFLDRATVAFVDHFPWSGDYWGDWRDHDRPMFVDDLEHWEYVEGRIEVMP